MALRIQRESERALVQCQARTPDCRQFAAQVGEIAEQAAEKAVIVKVRAAQCGGMIRKKAITQGEIKILFIRFNQD